MNEEEKKAVENIKELKTLFEIDDKKDFEATPLVQKEIAKDLKTLLNLIDKMKNCINILDDELKERNKTINEKKIIIEKLQKENEELKERIREHTLLISPYYVKENFISVQKVKDKIEEIDEKIKREENEKVVIYLHKQRNILQELLEGRK